MDIYTQLNPLSPKWITDNQLEQRLAQGLKGFSTGKIAIRTRKKLYKDKICEILGFIIPKNYKKTKPMFPIMNFDVYIQQSNNLQIWNEQIPPNRRYIIIKVGQNGDFETLKILNGENLIQYDSTGTLTTKLQAILDKSNGQDILQNDDDTDALKPHIMLKESKVFTASPADEPTSGNILPINLVFKILKSLKGKRFKDVLSDRQRGDMVHELCCQALGYKNYKDDGQFPDIKNQLLEIKFQTSPTIDIGKENPIDIEIKQSIKTMSISNQDIRYCIIFALVDNGEVVIKNIYMTSGKYFFNIFIQMQGKVKNSKIQLPLPKSFFDKL